MRTIATLILLISIGNFSYSQSNYSVLFIKGDVKMYDVKGSAKSLSISSQIRSFDCIKLQTGGYLFLQSNDGKYYDIKGPAVVKNSELAKHEYSISQFGSVSKYLLSLLSGEDKTKKKGTFGGVKAYSTRGGYLTNIYHYNSYKSNTIQFRWSKFQSEAPYQFDIVNTNISEPPPTILFTKVVTDTFLSLTKAAIPAGNNYWTVLKNTNDYSPITLILDSDSINIAHITDSILNIKAVVKVQRYLIVADYFEKLNLIFDANIYYQESIKFSKGKHKISIKRIYEVFKETYPLSIH